MSRVDTRPAGLFYPFAPNAKIELYNTFDFYHEPVFECVSICFQLDEASGKLDGSGLSTACCVCLHNRNVFSAFKMAKILIASKDVSSEMMQI